MAKSIGRNRNTTDETTVQDGIPTVSDSAITLSASNTDRTEFKVTVRGEHGWVREMPAATEPTVRKGTFIHAGGSHTFSGDDIHTGEFSGINDKNNKTPIFYVTEH